jgi:hypothetical protein
MELWTIRPMAFTFTDLAYQLTLDLSIMIDGRWYDLPEGDEFAFENPRRTFILKIGGAVAIVVVIVLLAVLARKIGSGYSVLILILAPLAARLLSSAGIPIGVINQYMQTTSKIVPGG